MVDVIVEYLIDRRGGLSPYLQIIEQTKRALRLGVLQPGDQLPTAREVVEATAINPNTVLKAYRELEREGLIESRRGVGTFVRRSLAKPQTVDDSALHADLTAWIARARDIGLEREDIAALVDTALDRAYPTSTEATEESG
ncbi:MULTISPECIES: GntR family transcriptional regulator [Kitasatospora]|uniref:GntR family transcriptional regulator n=2 Tax=Kitasatospora TaxID=2063 RepID=A0ABT1IZI5_9ACTN|nr:GntR family transcriptional regulator [Kitasatospora paracochleata]MCP2310565.1 GntR family transcriptional regulator [Kitasatospora paracochleata]